MFLNYFQNYLSIRKGKRKKEKETWKTFFASMKVYGVIKILIKKEQIKQLLSKINQ